jgi:hypothetical protein
MVEQRVPGDARWSIATHLMPVLLQKRNGA